MQNIPGPFHQAPQAIQDEQTASAKFDLCSIVAPISVAALLHACALLDASLIVHIAFLHPTHPASDKQKTTPLQGSPSAICFYIFMSSVSTFQYHFPGSWFFSLHNLAYLTSVSSLLGNNDEVKIGCTLKINFLKNIQKEWANKAQRKGA